MKKFLVGMILLLFSFHAVAAKTTKDIVFFGDSLSDDGNLYQILKILPKSPPYFQGRFSNGQTWAEHLAKYFYDKSLAEYSNYAYGGATAVLHNLRTDKFIAPVLLPEELDLYFAQSLRKDKSQTFYALWIGANDYLYEQTSDINKITDRVVDQISWAVDTLLGKGGQGIIVLNLPDLSMTPYARSHQNALRLAQISNMHNEKLKNAIDRLAKKYPKKIIYMDIYALFFDVLNNTAFYNTHYGMQLLDTSQPCWSGGVLGMGSPVIDEQEIALKLHAFRQQDAISHFIVNTPSLYEAYQLGNHYNDATVCGNADEHVFWDELHPTAVVHRLLSQIIVEKLKNQLA